MSIESTRFLSALAPRVYEGNDPSEKLGCLKHSANLFALGRSITVSVVREGVVNEQKNIQQSWLTRALKMAAIATLILPLLAFLSAKLYVKLNPLQIQEPVTPVAKPTKPAKEIELVALSSLSAGPHPEVEGLVIDNLTDIEIGLMNFPNLKSVKISKSYVQDVRFLKHCPKLTMMNLTGYKRITYFSFADASLQLKVIR
jgi:hypothetical protein